MKDNILRNCYYKRNEYVGKETFRIFTSDESLLNECCDELVQTRYLLCKDNNYKITELGICLYQKIVESMQ